MEIMSPSTPGPTTGSVKSCLRFLSDVGPKPSEILVSQTAFFCFFSLMTQAHCSSLPSMILETSTTETCSHSPRPMYIFNLTHTHTHTHTHTPTTTPHPGARQSPGTVLLCIALSWARFCHFPFILSPHPLSPSLHGVLSCSVSCPKPPGLWLILLLFLVCGVSFGSLQRGTGQLKVVRALR